MSNFEKYVDLLGKIASKSAQLVESGTKDLTSKLQIERKKIELKSQIGQHERQMSKAYEKIGEAYFKHLEEGTEIGNLDEVLDILRSNKKVVALLEEQLKELEAN